MGRHFGAKIEEKQDDSPKLSPHFFHKVISSREVMPSGANEQENGIAATAKVYFSPKEGSSVRIRSNSESVHDIS